MAKTIKDAYPNVAFGSCQMTAADTLTFALITFGIGIFQGIALVIHKILYYPSVASMKELQANTDDLHLCLCSSNRLTSITDVSQPAIISSKSLISTVGGAAYNAFERPIIDDYTGLPGGGILVPPNPLYIGMSTAGAAAASQVTVKLQCTFKELSDAEYLELIQSVYPANVA